MKYEKYITKNIAMSCFLDKNIFITGGNCGIGFSLAKQCAYLGANVYLLCRNEDKANNAIKEIKAEYPNANVSFIKLDLADFESVRNAVTQIKKENVDVFVNNAGVYRLPKSTTKDGLEIIMGTNFIGTLYLNDLLREHFEQNNLKVKVVFESSLTSKFVKFNFDDFFMDKKYKQMKIYAQSKLGINSIYFDYISHNEKSSNISYSLTHPGIVYTPLIKKGYRNKVFHFFASIFMKTFFHSPDKAALSLLKGIADDSKESTYGPRGILGSSGYPKHWKVRKPKDYEKAIALGRDIIKSK